MNTDPIQDQPLRVSFTKMHGLGNDFMVIDQISHPVELTPAQIRQLGDRHRGVGFDQLLIIAPPTRPDADFSYRIFNADGSEVEHCGNGARCFARYVLKRGLIARSPIRVQTTNRLLELHINDQDLVSVDMGEPDFSPAALPFTTGSQSGPYQIETEQHGTVSFQAVSMGNPHIVLTTSDCDTAPVGSLGPLLCTHAAFPQGVNVGFMQIIDRDTIRLRVFERGAGETEACGTGACAAVVCGIEAGKLNARVRTLLTGGELTIEWAGTGKPVTMTGPATAVFEGTVCI
ncbi:MAG: diaminopimelate epimerase [Pseudohongiella sp.]|uniref:diaminopimelate epimerase n=1 Tax=Pseudohongiella sp. TaxID=1979412 RepID=UPI0034A062FA